MDYETGRPNHIEDVLITLHTGQWFGWSDSKNKVYANLVIHDASKEKPTQEFLESELARLQSEYDSQEYARNRTTAYASTGDQLDMQYWDNVNGTTTWKDHVAAIKAAHPKP